MKKKAEVVVTETPTRNARKVRTGLVSSNKMEKTVVIKLVRRVRHPLYGKTVLKTEKFKAHDEIGCDIGDTVEIMETRPISKEKHWRVTRIIEKVK
ncbi:MAG: 30S ribosomal protein S17 [Armatimonadetes bacterium]|nr:30S ribosomal protein S17 [Armatimonadota bacterium]